MEGHGRFLRRFPKIIEASKRSWKVLEKVSEDHEKVVEGSIEGFQGLMFIVCP